MREIEAQEIPAVSAALELAVFFIHTPLCGTCRLARRMLDIALAAGPELPVYAVNANTAPQWCREWRVESVPCLILLSGGKPIRKRYRFGSVPELYHWLKPLRLWSEDHE